MQTESRLEHNSDDKASEAFELRSNNRYVVPLGVLMVLCTIYLMIAGLQTNYDYYFKPGVAALNPSSNPPNVDATNYVHTQPQPLCRQVDIFTENALKGQANLLKQQSKQSSNNLAIRRKQQRISKSKTTKKDITKKSNTAEPIIYLFALVFIYLLLKAASDINQHYKSKKGDKRLRRCSLQSYAQKEQRSSHLDRRASKDALLQSRHYIFTEARSVSLDRFKRRDDLAIESKDLLKIMRKQSTIAEPARIYHPAKLSEPIRGRRLSVPLSINYQTVHVAPPAPAPVAPLELARRGSVISVGDMMTPLALIAPSTGLQTMPMTDLKRRVRMINRH
ncbi:uncharacterized protein LOC6568747 isoform X2 [Drosophila grimshawi]|uniref:uncharacterized protein LOC6568747 isoform X2 n=1 Tax=Drosophila grimshawi TaxID=7222 RepID=UPI000C8708C6|nr:uncharacterized protein LOC6568747 isoform X2 [Drosophila grimshawi]